MSDQSSFARSRQDHPTLAQLNTSPQTLSSPAMASSSIASPPVTVTTPSSIASDDSPLPEFKRPSASAITDSPNARSKSVTVADGQETYGVLNRHPAVKNDTPPLVEEKVVKLPTFRVGVSEDRNKRCRRTMEDAHSFVYDYAGIRGQGYFAVFDGHAGKHAAEWCGQNFHEYLLDALLTYPDEPIPELLNKTFLVVDSRLTHLAYRSRTHSGCTAVVAFLRMEHDTPKGRKGFTNPSLSTRGLMEGRGEEELEAETSGNMPSRRSSMGAGSSGGIGGAASPSHEQSLRRKMSGRRIRDFVRGLTGSHKADDSAVDDDEASDIGRDFETMDPVSETGARRVLYLANVGDARAVICRGGGKAVRLTYDHKGSDPQEAKRITDAGGFVMNNRVNGVLAVTRSLGDASMKEFVVGSPYTTETVLDDDDEFLIVACDGLWDVCEDQDAVDLVRGVEDPQEASKKLLEHALGNYSTDNLSVMLRCASTSLLVDTGAAPPSYAAVTSERDVGDVPYDPAADTHWATRVNAEGRIDVDVDLASVPTVPPSEYDGGLDVDTLRSDECPPLNIVIFIVGSRGDVQPYLALALELIRTRGHRVRLATHAIFADLVKQTTVRLAGLTDENGTPLTSKLEHFDIGGSPEELMSYMVRNPGLVPGITALASGDIRRKRRMVKEMLVGCYLSCFTPNQHGEPFAADAIISNPPSFAHIHVSEALGIPLIMSFTMPWTPTTAFPHPLVAAKSSSPDHKLNNYASFLLADALMWQGLGDLINHFRYSILGLRPLSHMAGPLTLQRLQIPFTYAWSEHLLPKPADWKGNMDVVGFYTMDSDTRFTPDAALAKFLAAGEPPVYFGFGSVVVDKPDQLTNIILNAVERTGIRAVVSAGWAELGAGDDIPSSVFIIKGNVPHDWLFAEGRVAAVCHHGGAGTTAAGLRLGVPTIVVPFFGDQWFWGNAVYHAGAGPEPIPYTELTVGRLVAGLEVALAPATLEAARKMGEQISVEDGVSDGVRSFHRHLPLLNMRCNVDELQVAVWWSEAMDARLSARVAAVLVEERILAWRDLVPHRPVDHDSLRHYTDPFASFGQSVLNLGAVSMGSASELFYAPARGLGGLVWGVPKASFDVVSSFHEGLENVPGILGGQTRRRGKVDSLTTGVQEGAKGLAYGIFDGITGLVTEPYRGAKSGGVDGFVKGAWNGVVSLGPRLAGAGLGLVVHPTTGAFRGLRTRLGMAGLLEQSVMYSPRQAASHKAALGVSKAERAEIITAWARLCSPTATDMRRAEHEARRAANERRLLTSDPQTPSMSKTQVGSKLSKGLRNNSLLRRKKRQGSVSSVLSMSPSGRTSPTAGPSREDKTNTFTTVSSPSREKDPRWREVHDTLTLPGYKRDVLEATGGPSGTFPLDIGLRRPLLRWGTGVSFASTSTADVAQAGIERWDTQSIDSAATTTTRGTTTADSASQTSEIERRKRFWHKGKGKGKGRSRN
ncbi:uncharacterized protein CcaverHIS019_0310070 [Cutaneotrichosporon cavernicola]|uniref:PPM-type phosphatase domain-containing protein n=1 Tax=Cutaneotrichosporon cavernicola TaxID=279322 RepID=A0AA48L2H7_9TREE|nr:uncharacterized protein CcaverHIS019_0310070 [Cutaneotrichosporon cavernicola]BEI90937.1 hypothetical protein CcaverHIS019_0310070 [Cutaneotrichosporon cavernicola]